MDALRRTNYASGHSRGGGLLSVWLAAGSVISSQSQCVSAAFGAKAGASTGEDFAVTLRDGSFYRGVLLELTPQDHVTIRLSSGEVKRFPWSKVKKAEPAGQSKPPTSSTKDDDDDFSASPNKPASKESSQTEDRSEAAVLLEVDSDNPQAVVKQLIDQSSSIAVATNLRGGVAVGGSSSESWRQVCVVPCGVRVSPHLSYRIEGPFPTSSLFVLPQGTDSVRLQVKAGSRAGAILGGGLMGGIGLGSLLGAGLFLAFAHDTKEQLIAGGVWMGVGVAIGLIGIPILLASRTEVHASGGQRIAKRKVQWTGQGIVF